MRPAVERSGLLRGEATDADRAAAAAAWAAARAALSDPGCDLVVLDELHAALRHGLVPLDEVLAALAARPPRQEVVTTGRGAPDALVAAAALVTEMTAVRHPYPDVPARRGVEL
ncbi:MAG: Cob(I)yrinic acid a,c-diamide adenosyltransferase [Actinobacteria bacterium ADurb.BinA094]|nr:MAG: Cob(I)yrinic acid a,c-diamide adenosyltransferase [Actinobacteria bacterium ADurb.BinA094]